MLNPTDRSLYIDALTPPPGFQLDHAVGTTYSLDLPTLLSVPISFALNDWRADSSNLLEDPVAVLEALRRYADRITLFCQAGQTCLPSKMATSPLFAYLEPMIYEVALDKGSFHPKTWLVRYTGPEDAVLYRFICLSRNLSTDSSWDTSLVLEGTLGARKLAIAKNHPLGSFIESLPKIALRPPAPASVRAAAIGRLGSEVRRVPFDCPEPFEEVVAFWPLGKGYPSPLEPGDNGSRSLVISPFLHKESLSHWALSKSATLISRKTALDELDPETLDKFRDVYVLKDEFLTTEPDDSVAASARDLHAKLFVLETGWDAHVWTGSANATRAAFQDNVEFLVELKGKKSRAGIGRLLGEDDSKAEPGLAPFLRLYHRPADPVTPLATLRANERTLERLKQRLATSKLELKLTPVQAGYLMTLSPTVDTDLQMGEVRGACWPITFRPGNQDRDLALLVEHNHVEFSVNLASLTGFVAFRLELGEGDERAELQFVFNVPIVNAPDDRLSTVLGLILENRAGFLRYLTLLLASDEEDLGSLLSLLDAPSSDHASPNVGQGSGLPLLEELLRTLARCPSKLDAIDHLISDLQRTEDGRALLPEHFLSVWEPLWARRQQTL